MRENDPRPEGLPPKISPCCVVGLAHRVYGLVASALPGVILGATQRSNYCEQALALNRPAAGKKPFYLSPAARH